MTKFLRPTPATTPETTRTKADVLRRKLIEVGGIAYPVDEWDVPMLMPEMQPTGMELPCDTWGSRPRKRSQSGTFNFYCEDYKFTSLFSNPMALVALAPKAAIEVNCSTDLNTPLAYLLGVVYAKRWLSRTWQAEGVKIWVDMNFAAGDTEHVRYQMLGVPQGWRAYATRGLADNVDYNVAQYWAACVRAGVPEAYRAGSREILFAVVGGGRKLQNECRKRGWIYCPSTHERIKGGFE